MSTKIIDIECPHCHAAVDIEQRRCKYCKEPIIISTFNSVYDMPIPMVNKLANTNRQLLDADPENKEVNFSSGCCLLRLKLYDKALNAFEKAIQDNYDNTESFFYAAICLLGGKKAFLAQRSEIDKIEEYINAALMIEPKGVYHYLLAYIKYDYFSRKSYKTSPTYQEALAAAQSLGVSFLDFQQLYANLGVTCPEPIAIF